MSGEKQATNLVEALDALQRAGRIASPFIDGMLLTLPNGDRFRLADGWNSLEDEWVEGRAGLDPDAVDWDDDGPPVLPPVLDDPATVGCLMFLLREAVVDDHVTTHHPSHNLAEGSWHVWAGGGSCLLGHGGTEAEAIVSALIALAAGVP